MFKIEKKEVTLSAALLFLALCTLHGGAACFAIDKHDDHSIKKMMPEQSSQEQRLDLGGQDFLSRMGRVCNRLGKQYAQSFYSAIRSPIYAGAAISAIGLSMLWNGQFAGVQTQSSIRTKYDPSLITECPITECPITECPLPECPLPEYTQYPIAKYSTPEYNNSDLILGKYFLGLSVPIVGLFVFICYALRNRIQDLEDAQTQTKQAMQQLTAQSQKEKQDLENKIKDLQDAQEKLEASQTETQQAMQQLKKQSDAAQTETQQAMQQLKKQSDAAQTETQQAMQQLTAQSQKEKQELENKIKELEQEKQQLKKQSDAAQTETQQAMQQLKEQSEDAQKQSDAALTKSQQEKQDLEDRIQALTEKFEQEKQQLKEESDAAQTQTKKAMQQLIAQLEDAESKIQELEEQLSQVQSQLNQQRDESQATGQEVTIQLKNIYGLSPSQNSQEGLLDGQNNEEIREFSLPHKVDDKNPEPGDSSNPDLIRTTTMAKLCGLLTFRR